jgi:hypothetical protein
MESLTFSLPDAYGGMADTNGIARVEGDELVLEFSSTVLGVYQGGVREVRIPIEGLESAETKKRFFRFLLEIRARSMRSFEGVPGVKAGSLKLQVGRNDKLAAEHLANAIATSIAKHHLRRIDEAIRRHGEEL